MESRPQQGFKPDRRTVVGAFSGAGEVRRPASVLTLAWVTTLLISRLPEIVLREAFGLRIDQMPWVIVGSTLVLWLAARSGTRLHPLRPYFAVMVPVTVIVAVVPLIFGSATWEALVPPTTQPMGVLLAERVALVLLALPMIGIVHAIGGKHGESYLRPGLVNGRSSVRLPGMTTPLRWSVVGPLGGILLAVLTASMALGSLPSGIDLAGTLPLLGVAAMAAVLNSFFEELVFRAAPLSPLAPVIGVDSAVMVMAVWFGLGHFYGGIPSGAMGALMAGLVALAFGRAMVSTRGLAWPWAWHFSVDLVIYASIALTATSPAVG